MPDLASQVHALQETIALAQKKTVQAEALRERAQIKLDSAVSRLSAMFNVSNLEEAKKVLSSLEEEVRKNIIITEDALRKING